MLPAGDRITHRAGYRDDNADARRREREIAHLELAFRVAAAKHVQHDEFVPAVPIQVRKVDPHRKHARPAQRQPVHGAKLSFAIVDPDTIFAGKIVAEINVRRAVVVDVAKHHRQSPVVRRFLQRLSLFIKKRSVGKRNRSELPTAFVAQKHISFAVFLDLSVFAQLKPPNQIRLRNRSTVDAQYDRLSVDRVPVETGLRVISDGVRAVIGNIKVQIPVAINVGQGQGHAGLPRIERWPQFGEMPFAIVEEDVRSSAHRVHDQVQITVAVNVS